MKLGDIGSWASIVGLGLTLLTFLLAARVNSKVNRILETESDENYFKQKISNVLEELKETRNLAEEENIKILFSTKQYSKVKTAMQIVNASWDVLYIYNNQLIKKMKIHKWKHKFEEIKKMYDGQKVRSCREMADFLGEFITFLEKEQSIHER